MKIIRTLFLLLSLFVLSASAQLDGVGAPFRSEGDPDQVFPYELVNYTTAGHEYRMAHAQAILLGRVTQIRELEGTDKEMKWVADIRIERMVRADRPSLEKAKTCFVRYFPVGEFLENLKEGDRCLFLLRRDTTTDSGLVIPTEMHLYPVSEEGIATRFFKNMPTAEAPELQQLPLSKLVEQVQRVKRRISMEDQASRADLVMIGIVGDSRQGDGPNSDHLFVQLSPDRVFKGDPGKGLITLQLANNVNRWTIATLSRPTFRKGSRILIFANKDPTLSSQGPGNPAGETRWTLPLGLHSTWAVARSTIWRRGDMPRSHEEVFEDLKRWCATR
ncbi:MAG: hypothetical protein QGH30_08345 [Candidatus Krumholzibacteria bacterium]|jgi:hypothetical protein|nr:hypothetical protein [Candidatus Krumholzibacteria bacterium]